MRAVVYCAERSSGVAIKTLPRPIFNKSNNNQVLCKVSYGGLNPVDAKGLAGDKLPSFLHGLWHSYLNNHVCGIDFSGVVVETSTQSKYTVGDRICGNVPVTQGSFAEYIVVPESTICRIPANVTDEQAAAIPLVGLTIEQAFSELPFELSPYRHVLIIGGSGGTGHLQYCRMRGAKVTAVSINIVLYVFMNFIITAYMYTLV